jgi:proteasome assembly chaperone (PAC2) family protein
MNAELVFEHMPELDKPVAIFGFGGWANGGNVAIGMAEFLIRNLKAKRFASVLPDTFYRFDDFRPTVQVAGGLLTSISFPEAALYGASQDQTGVDVIVFKGDEPQLRWFAFVDTLLSCCKRFHVQRIISLGGLQDNVAHTETVISGLASNRGLLDLLKDMDVNEADYEGPGAIHSLILTRAQEMGIESVSLWGHCPFYLQGTHLKLLCAMADVLATLTGLKLDVSDLEKGWEVLAQQIQHFVDGNPELQNVIRELMESKSPSRSLGALRKDGNVIYLDRFLPPKHSDG